jgi:hypothetical protein
MKAENDLYLGIVTEIQTSVTDADIFRHLTAPGVSLDLLAETAQKSILFNLINMNRWALLWKVLTSNCIRTDNLGVLSKTIQQIQAALRPEEAADHDVIAPESTDEAHALNRDIWEENIFPLLNLEDRGRLGRVCKAWHNNNSDFIQLRAEFPDRFQGLLKYHQPLPKHAKALLDDWRNETYQSYEEWAPIFAAIARGSLTEVINCKQTQTGPRSHADDMSYFPTDREDRGMLKRAFVLAFLNGNLAVILYLLQFQSMWSKERLIREACHFGAIEILQFAFLIDPPQQISHLKLVNRHEALTIACQHRQVALVEYILSLGVSLDLVTPYHEGASSILHHLIETENYKLLRKILSYEHLRADNLGVLTKARYDFLQLDKGIEPAITVRSESSPQSTDQSVLANIWRWNIFPKLSASDQLRLSQVSKLLRKSGVAIVSLFHEFREDFKVIASTGESHPINAELELAKLRKQVYSSDREALLFSLVAEQPLVNVEQELTQLYMHSGDHFLRLTFSPRRDGNTILTLSIIGDRLSHFILLRGWIHRNYAPDLYEIAEAACHYYASDLMKLLLLAEPTALRSRLPDLLCLASFERAAKIVNMLAPLVRKTEFGKNIIGSQLFSITHDENQRLPVYTIEALVTNGAFVTDPLLEKLCSQNHARTLNIVLTEANDQCSLVRRRQCLRMTSKHGNLGAAAVILAHYPELLPEYGKTIEKLLRKNCKPTQFLVALQQYQVHLTPWLIALLLKTAYQAHELSILEHLIPSTLDVNQPLPATWYSRLPLTVAWQENNESLFNYLLAQGARVHKEHLPILLRMLKENKIENTGILEKNYQTQPTCVFSYHPAMAPLRELYYRIYLKTTEKPSWSLGEWNTSSYLFGNIIYKVPKGIKDILTLLEKIEHLPYPRSLSAIQAVCVDIYHHALKKTTDKEGPKLFTEKRVRAPDTRAFYGEIVIFLKPIIDGFTKDRNSMNNNNNLQTTPSRDYGG